MRIFTFNDGLSLDLDSIESISPVRGDPSWQTYYIRTKSGKDYEIFETRTSTSSGTAVRQLPRNKMMEAWLDLEYPKNSKPLKE